MRQIFVFTLLSLILLISQSLDSCQPLSPRLQFGNQFHQSTNPQKLMIKFNTKSQCPRSYVTITDSTGSIRKIYCLSKTITASEKMLNYKAFIQSCSIVDEIDYSEKFNYIAYGSNSTSGTSIPFDFTPIQTSLIHPNSTEPLHLIILADWAELHDKIGTYKSLNQSLDAILTKTPIHGIIINGDIAYNLDSNNGTNYQQFLVLASRIGRYVPVFVNTGNHQHNSDDNKLLLYQSFEQYGMETKLATGFSLGNLYFIAFDPYQTIYQNNSVNLRVQQDPSLSGLKQYIQIGLTAKKIIIPISHYPFKCSNHNKNCQNDTTILKQYFDLMYQNHIKFYIGSHYHVYQRIYPYCQNGSFNIIKPPYYIEIEQKCLISIIEGIAGNDDKIVEKYDVIEKYTAAVSFGKTGFGLLQGNPGSVKYQHYTTQNVLTLADQFQIVFKKSNQPQQIIKLVHS